MAKTAVVTGAGSGVGRAVALGLAKKGWQVALVGRRRAMLAETAAMVGGQSQNILICPCDIADATAVGKMATSVFRKFKSVEVLVNSAGTNTPARSLAVLTLAEYQRLLATNLHGAYLCTQAFLPAMRRQSHGTIVNIISDAGKQASPKSGAAYAMSKFGLSGLTQSINAEERANGIRACGVFPGDIDTPLLDLRPLPPTPEARIQMLQAEDVAECAFLAINLPPRALVEEILIRPR